MPMTNTAAPGAALDAETIAFAGRCFDLARRGYAAELEELIAQGLPANLTNDKGDTLLILASYHGHRDAAAMLLRRGADPDRHNDRGQTALAAAAFKGDERVVAALLDGGAEVEACGPDGRTALMTAAMFDRTGIVDLLLARGADPDRLDAAGLSAADLAEKMNAYGTPRRLAAASQAKVERLRAPG
jgi:ankyrin repeat protein